MNRNQRAYRRFVSVIASKRSNLRALYRLFQIALLASLCVFIIDALAASTGMVSFGELGDFFGGVLNPILTFLTFMGMLITIVIQQTELRESRVEMKRSADALLEQSKSLKQQNFESTFFQMLSVHSGIVSAIDLRDGAGNVTRGRDCFSVFYARLEKIYHKGAGCPPGSTSEEIIRFAYQNFWDKHQVELGHYFRYLYNLMGFVRDSDFVDGPYLRLIKAQLSDQELLILFYNCIASEYGRKFKALATDLSVFDNMPIVKILDQSHYGMISEHAFSKGGVVG